MVEDVNGYKSEKVNVGRVKDSLLISCTMWVFIQFARTDKSDKSQGKHSNRGLGWSCFDQKHQWLL